MVLERDTLSGLFIKHQRKPQNLSLNQVFMLLHELRTKVELSSIAIMMYPVTPPLTISAKQIVN